jgi:hypothetical protein
MAEPLSVGAEPARGSAPRAPLTEEPTRGSAWLGWGRLTTKERRKLISHVTVLRARAEWLSSTAPDAESPASIRIRNLLEQVDWCKGDDLAPMHDHADQLEELLPHIAEESYLRTMLAYKLTRMDEPIRLAKLLPETELCELRRLSSS